MSKEINMSMEKAMLYLKYCSEIENVRKEFVSEVERFVPKRGFSEIKWDSGIEYSYMGKSDSKILFYFYSGPRKSNESPFLSLYLYDYTETQFKYLKSKIKGGRKEEDTPKDAYFTKYYKSSATFESEIKKDLPLFLEAIEYLLNKKK